MEAEVMTEKQEEKLHAEKVHLHAVDPKDLEEQLSKSKSLCQGHEALEEQLVLWEQVQSGQEEVMVWLDAMLHKLSDSTQQFGDTVNVKSVIHKYKVEVPYFKEVYDALQNRLTSLQESCGTDTIPALQQVQADLAEQFAKAAELSENLGEQLENFTNQKEKLEKEMTEHNTRVSQLRETLASIDDLAGSDEELIDRLENARVVQQGLESQRGEIESLQNRLDSLAAQYHFPEAISMAKDLTVLKKKYDAASQKASKVELSLEQALEQHAEEAQIDQQRWLTAAQAKVTWCSDSSGDKYSVEAKLATVVELMNVVHQGEEKIGIVAEKLEKLKATKTESERSEIEDKKQNKQHQWQAYVQELQLTKAKLESSMKQWQRYDNLYDGLTKWVRDTETKVRSESGLRPDLASKQQQKDTFRIIDSDIAAHKSGLDRLSKQADDIVKSSPDSHVPSYVHQLSTRYKSLHTSVQEHLAKQQKCVSEHEAFNQNYKHASEWLHFAVQKLEMYCESTGEKEAIECRLDNLRENKDQGQSKFSLAVEKGEKLYPTTSTDGREAIRQQLRLLRDSWESYVDSMNDEIRRLVHALSAWNAYNDSYNQVTTWVKQMEFNLTCHVEQKNNLAEKRAMLQHYRAVGQEITRYQAVVNSVTARGEALDTKHVSSKLQALNTRYKTLADTIKEHVNECEGYVTEHQAYTETYTLTREWLQLHLDKLDVCAEPVADKHAIQNKLDRLQVLELSRDEGEELVSKVKFLADKALPHTAAAGQTQIRRELDALSHDWYNYSSKLKDTTAGLEASKRSWEEFELSFDTLSKWLRDQEMQLKDQALKSTLVDKKNKLDKCKDIQKKFASRQPDVDALCVRSQQLASGESKIAANTEQLNSRYTSLRGSVKEVVSRWESFVSEHEKYEGSYSSSMSWLNDLSKRLSQCEETSGDRQAIEEAQSRLHELYSEKEQGAEHIHLTVELGEKLYPKTAVEGRELVRQQLRRLREKYESFRDSLWGNKRQMEMSLVQLNSHEDSSLQFTHWMADTHDKIKTSSELKATLPEKKAVLQNHKKSRTASSVIRQKSDKLATASSSVDQEDVFVSLPLIKLSCDRDMNLRTGFSKFYKSQEQSDIHVWCQGGSFRAHKILLASQSTFFESRLNQSKNNGEIVEKLDVDADFMYMEPCMQFVYTGCIEISPSQLSGLTDVAKQLGVNQLYRLCKAQEYKGAIVDPGNCLAMLCAGREIDDDALVNRAKPTVLENVMYMFDDSSFAELCYDCVCELITDQGVKVSGSEDLLTAVSMWVNHDVSSRQQHLLTLLQKLPLNEMKHTALQPYLMVHVFKQDPQCLSLLENAISEAKKRAKQPA